MSEMCKVMEDLRNESYAEGQAEGRVNCTPCQGHFELV